MRIAEFAALTAKFLFESLILSIFTLTLWRLIRIKRRQIAFSRKERLTLAFVAYLYLFNTYYTVYCFLAEGLVLLPFSSFSERTADNFGNRFFHVNMLILYKVLDYSNCLGFLYLFSSITRSRRKRRRNTVPTDEGDLDLEINVYKPQLYVSSHSSGQRKITQYSVNREVEFPGSIETKVDNSYEQYAT